MKISNLEELNAAIAEVGEIEALEATIKAEADGKIATIKAEAQSRLIVSVDGEQIPTRDRAAALFKAAESYATRNRQQILEAEKSRRLTAGTFGFRKQKDKLEPLGKKTEKHWLSVILDAVIDGVVAVINRYAAGGGSLKTADLVTIDIKWDKAGILSAIAEKRIKANDLKPFGLRFVEGEDEFFLKPDEAKIEAIRGGKCG